MAVGEGDGEGRGGGGRVGEGAELSLRRCRRFVGVSEGGGVVVALLRSTG